jgi:phage terminase large subunit-like protein
MGGDICESTLRVVDQNVPIRRVTAKHNKHIRAEPMSALYEQARVHHVYVFEKLEYQLCSFAPGSTDSPDRLDDLVYSLTELLVKQQGGQLLFCGIKMDDELEVARRCLNNDHYR